MVYQAVNVVACALCTEEEIIDFTDAPSHNTATKHTRQSSQGKIEKLGHHPFLVTPIDVTNLLGTRMRSSSTVMSHLVSLYLRRGTGSGHVGLSILLMSSSTA